MHELTKDTLLNVGFVDIAAWFMGSTNIDYRLDGEAVKANETLLDVPNALYAFALGDKVQYIGKTARTIRKRFVNYRKPAKSQPTNLRCNAKIKLALRANEEVRILVFSPISELRFLDFEINLAAGLEDALIKSFDPPWNGREKGKPITEEAEREELEAANKPEVASTADQAAAPLKGDRRGVAAFDIRLGPAYYDQGLINPGVEASKHLGAHGEPIQICFDDGTEPILSNINRRANPSGAVRVVGRNRQIADWFRRRFKMGDIVKARVLDRNRIFLGAPVQALSREERVSVRSLPSNEGAAE